MILFILTLFGACSRLCPAEGELHRLRKASEPVPEKLCVRASCSQSAYLQGRKVPISSLIELSDDAPQLFLTRLCSPSYATSITQVMTSTEILMGWMSSAGTIYTHCSIGATFRATNLRPVGLLP